LENLKILKTGPVLSLGLEHSDHTCHKKPNPSHEETVPLMELVNVVIDPVNIVGFPVHLEYSNASIW
jgi:hypothetical protein